MMQRYKNGCGVLFQRMGAVTVLVLPISSPHITSITCNKRSPTGHLGHMPSVYEYTGGASPAPFKPHELRGSPKDTWGAFVQARQTPWHNHLKPFRDYPSFQMRLLSTQLSKPCGYLLTDTGSSHSLLPPHPTFNHSKPLEALDHPSGSTWAQQVVSWEGTTSDKLCDHGDSPDCPQAQACISPRPTRCRIISATVLISLGPTVPMSASPPD